MYVDEIWAPSSPISYPLSRLSYWQGKRPPYSPLRVLPSAKNKLTKTAPFPSFAAAKQQATPQPSSPYTTIHHHHPPLSLLLVVNQRNTPIPAVICCRAQHSHPTPLVLTSCRENSPEETSLLTLVHCRVKPPKNTTTPSSFIHHLAAEKP